MLLRSDFSSSLIMFSFVQDWERALQNQESPVEQLKDVYSRLGTSSAHADAKIAYITDKWSTMINTGSSYAQRWVALGS